MVKLEGDELNLIRNLLDTKVKIPASYIKTYDRDFLKLKGLLKEKSFEGLVTDLNEEEQIAFLECDLLVDDSGQCYEHSMRFDVLG